MSEFLSDQELKTLESLSLTYDQWVKEGCQITNLYDTYPCDLWQAYADTKTIHKLINEVQIYRALHEK